MTGSEFVSSVALRAELEQLLDREPARGRGVDEDRLVRPPRSLAIAEPRRRFSSASCSSRLRKESSCPASSGSTAPPCVRRSRPSCARIARSRRAVMPEMPNARSTVATVTLPRSPSIARIRRRRSSGMTGGGASWRTLFEHRRLNLASAEGRGARPSRACTGSYVCATSRSHMFESTPLAPDATVNDHRNDHSTGPRHPAAQVTGLGSREWRSARCASRAERRLAHRQAAGRMSPGAVSSCPASGESGGAPRIPVRSPKERCPTHAVDTGASRTTRRRDRDGRRGRRNRYGNLPLRRPARSRAARRCTSSRRTR